MPLTLSDTIILYATKKEKLASCNGERHADFRDVRMWELCVLEVDIICENSTCITVSVTFVAFVPSVSFGMAYDFIDSVGNDVDVVSDSEVSVLMGRPSVLGTYTCSVQDLENLMK